MKPLTYYNQADTETVLHTLHRESIQHYLASTPGLMGGFPGGGRGKN